nr:hypothetical protein [Tanacetum cinerariifolium]
GGVAVVVLVTRVWWVTNGGDGSGGERRVRESGVEGWIDRVVGILFGFAGKISPEKFSGGGRRRRVVAGRQEAAAGGESTNDALGEDTWKESKSGAQMKGDDQFDKIILELDYGYK